ncbi:histidinol-phosphate aminotransferase [Neptunitalea chrysea]|uniref:Histidinol-phosphate aminotransferase n=1 Tax=Neptunitalea chrysea TaxID=1647581 RepID=A0A9W6B600_9FLAO|nr:histidinol-phosphate transaminase [Neptunitalea chrysea]GLB51942.1 histidinol-phosphate aminotransferase [Neptunitalea chrysea]
MTKSFDINSLVRANIAKLKAYSSARDEYSASCNDMVFLDANENPFNNGVNRYPDPYQRKVKELLAEQKGCSVNQMLLGNGSDEALDLIFRAFCEPGKDTVITLPPTYGMYKVLADLNEIENREVLLTKDFEPNVEEILRIADAHSKLLFICSPNNPTGNSFKAEKIRALLTNFSGLVVIDEAYIDFTSNHSWISEMQNFPNLIVTQTMSKAYALAGIRLGICYASEDVITILNKIKPPYNVNELTQKRALDQLQNLNLVERQVNIILAEREALIEALQTLSFVDTIYPTDANFILIKVDNATQRYNELLEKGIVIRNRTTQPLCENTLRITIGTKEENNILLTALKQLT